MQLARINAPETRISEILSSVRQAFVDKGFDGASMQDLARSAGMSVGNFYRYFPSKAEIVKALIATDMAQMQNDFATLLLSEHPMQTLRATLPLHLAKHQTAKDGQLWCEIAAAALRKPEIGAASSEMEQQIISCLTQVFAAETKLPLAEAERRFSAHAAFIILQFKASTSLCGTDNAFVDRDHLNAMIIRTIDATLNEVALAAPTPAAQLLAQT